MAKTVRLLDQLIKKNSQNNEESDSTNTPSSSVVSSSGRLLDDVIKKNKARTDSTQAESPQSSTIQPVEQPKKNGLMGFLNDIGSGILKGGAGALGSVGSLVSSAVTGNTENDFTKGTKRFQEDISKRQSENGSNGIADFIGNLPGGIVSGLVDPASYLVRGARNTPEMIAASIAAGSSDKNIRKEGINTQKLLQEKLFGKEVAAQGDKGMILEGLAQPASAILNVATGGAASGAKQVAKQGLKEVAKTAGKAGLINVAAGVPISVAQQLARGQEVTPESVAKDSLIQGVLGTTLAGIPAALHLKVNNRLSEIKAKQNLGENVIKDLTPEQVKGMTPQQIKVINESKPTDVSVKAPVIGKYTAKDLKETTDEVAYKYFPELFQSVDEGIALGEGGLNDIPRIHVNDLKRYFGNTEGIPAKYKRTSGAEDLDLLAQRAGFDDVDQYVEAIQGTLESRAIERERPKLLANVRRDPSIIAEAKKMLDEKMISEKKMVDINPKTNPDYKKVKANVEKDLGIKLTDNQAASIAENTPKPETYTPSEKTILQLPESNRNITIKNSNTNELSIYKPKSDAEFIQLKRAIDGKGDGESGLAGIPDKNGNVIHVTADNDAKLIENGYKKVDSIPYEGLNTPETAVSGRALATEQEAIKQGLTTGIEGKSQYTTTSYKENKITAEELVKNNKQGALDIIEGRSEASNPQIQETYKQLLKYAKENKDLDIYERLVRSDVAEKALSESAQTLGAAGFEADPSNPVTRVREVKKALEERASRRTTETKAKVTKAISGEVDKVLKVSENKSWNSFLEGIKC